MAKWEALNRINGISNNTKVVRHIKQLYM